MTEKKCFNCGKNPPRNDSSVICQECYDSYPRYIADIPPLEDLEDTFREVMKGMPEEFRSFK